MAKVTIAEGRLMGVILPNAIALGMVVSSLCNSLVILSMFTVAATVMIVSVRMARQT